MIWQARKVRPLRIKERLIVLWLRLVRAGYSARLSVIAIQKRRLKERLNSMPETSEATMALIIDRLQSIDRQMTHEQKNSAMSRQRLYDKLEGIEKQQDAIQQNQQQAAYRIEKLEGTIMTMSPTVQEFVDLKMKAQVAGRLGQFLWRAGGVILSMAAGAAAMWAAFWTYFNWR